MLVARYNSNGTLDTSFGGGSGYVRLDNGAREVGTSVAIQPDGKIVVGGYTSVVDSPTNLLVARFNTDGSLDDGSATDTTPADSFSDGGFKIGSPLPNTGYHSFGGGSLALQSDGSIIVAGYDDQDSTSGTAYHPLVMRFYGSNVAAGAPLIASSAVAATSSETSTTALSTFGDSELIAISPTTTSTSSGDTITSSTGTTSSSADSTSSDTRGGNGPRAADAVFAALTDPLTEPLLPLW
jgi:uncharacterized delta-60 repeat protein